MLPSSDDLMSMSLGDHSKKGKQRVVPASKCSQGASLVSRVLFVGYQALQEGIEGVCGEALDVAVVALDALDQHRAVALDCPAFCACRKLARCTLRQAKQARPSSQCLTSSPIDALAILCVTGEQLLRAVGKLDLGLCQHRPWRA